MTRIERLLFAGCLLAGCERAAFAQPSTSEMVPAQRSTDGRGVDLASGQLQIQVALVSFGDGATALGASLELPANGVGIPSTDFVNSVGYIVGGAIRPQAQVMGGYFNDEVGTHSNAAFPTGAGLFQEIRNIHTNPDGSKYTQSFGPSHFTRFTSTADPSQNGVYDAQGNRGISGPWIYGVDLMERFAFANGEEWRFNRQYVTVTCTYQGYGGCTTQPLARLRSIVSSRGFAIQFLYMSDVAPTTDANAGAWYAPRRVTAYNKAFISCDESLLQECTAVSALPSTDISYSNNGTTGTVTITEPGAAGGTELTFTKTGANWGFLTSHRQTAISGSTVSYSSAVDNVGGQYVQQVTDADGQSTYTRLVYVDDSGRPPYMYVTATNPSGGAIGGYGQMLGGHVETLYDELDRIWSSPGGWPYRDWGRGPPLGGGMSSDRDLRNNIFIIYNNPNQAGPSYFTAYAAVYPVHCTNPRTCNRPSSTTDANGNTTDYTYAPEHGGMLTETGPAVNGVRPQKRYEYAQRTAWTGNGSGGYAAGPPIWLLVRERACRTSAASGATCAGGAADEVITDYDYGPDSGPNTLLLRGIAVTAHDGTQIVTRRTCYGYDTRGNRISTTLPNANPGSCS